MADRIRSKNPFKIILDNPKFIEWLSRNISDINKHTLTDDQAAQSFIQKVKNSNKSQSLIDLYSKNFPNLIENTLILDLIIFEDRVFKTYNPSILILPMKKVTIENNKMILIKKVEEFIKYKLSCDYIIINNRAYIEYFDIEHRNESRLINKESREIYQYKVSRRMI